MFDNKKSGWVKSREDDKKIQTKEEVARQFLKNESDKQKTTERAYDRKQDDSNFDKKTGGRGVEAKV